MPETKVAHCECYIIKRNGEPLTTADYDKNNPEAPSRIEQCSLHTAAPAMFEALKLLLGSAGLNLIDQLPGDIQAINRAKLALSQAEK